jgi:transposase
MVTVPFRPREEGIMALSLPDARELSDEVLEALRLRAVRGCERGFTEADVADLLGVCRETVCHWWTAYRRGGVAALPHERSGRPLGSRRLLSDEQARAIQDLLDQKQPKDLGIAAPLWNRRAVAALIHQELGVTLALRTVGAYLRRWGYTPQRPARKSRHQDPEEVRQWLEETYPEVAERAKAEGADLYWCDEMGVGIDTYPGRGYARPGQPPLKEVTGSHARVNAVSAINNRGRAHFLTFTGSLDAAVFMTFLGLLVQATRKKIFLVVDRLQAHLGADVQAWVAARAQRIELVPLPRHTPERNPVEYLNNDAKAETNAGGLPHNQEELHANLDTFLHRLAFWPQRIVQYFCHPAVQYAAAKT